MQMKSRAKSLISKVIIGAVWLLIWQAASVLTGLELLLASPVRVFAALVRLMGTAAFYHVAAVSFLNITTGFFAGFAAGVLAGTAAGRLRIVERVLAPPVMLMKTLPMTSFIILLLIWFGAEHVSVLIAFLVVFPMVYIAVVQGLCNTDHALLEMAQIFRVGLFKKIRCIYVPQVMPFVEANLKTALGMCWKAGVSAEVIGLVNHSIGEQLYYSKLYLATAELFAWSIVVVAVSMLFEAVFLRLLRLAEKKLLRI